MRTYRQPYRHRPTGLYIDSHRQTQRQPGQDMIVISESLCKINQWTQTKVW